MKAIPQKSADPIRALAIAFKIIAIIEAIGAVLSLASEIILEMHPIAPMHSLTPLLTLTLPVFFVVLVVALWVVISNLWIVRSPILFQICLVIASMPFILGLLSILSSLIDSISPRNFEMFFERTAILMLLLPWPLSLVLSRIRFKRGEAFKFA
jgi:hypothetical protein